MRTSNVRLSLLIVAALVAGLGSADAATIRRTAPYDVGCVAGCAVAFEPARQGRLIGHPMPGVCGLYYGPPFVWPCLTTSSSTTGIYFETTRSARFTVTARVRDDVGEAVRVCTHLRTMSLHFPGSCVQVPQGGAVDVRSTFNGITVPSGRHLVTVVIDQGAGSAMLDSITVVTSRA